MSTPFGPSGINNQSSQLYYLKPLNEQTITNRFTHQTWDGTLFGFAGDHNLAIRAPVTAYNATGTSRISNISTACLTFDDVVGFGGGFQINGPGSFAFGTNATLNIAGSINKTGSGAFIVQGVVPEVNKTVNINGGSLVLDYGAWDTNKLYRTNTSTWTGVDVELRGGSFVQPAPAVTFGTGASRIRRTQGSTARLEFPTAVARVAGTTIDFGAGAVKNPGATYNAPFGQFTVDGADFAMRDASDMMVAFTNYDAWGAGDNVLHSGSVNFGTAGETHINFLKIHGAGSIDMHPDRRLIFNGFEPGLLFTGTGDHTINGGWYRSRVNYIHHYADGTLTINSYISNSNDGQDGGIVKTGPGRLVLTPDPGSTFRAGLRINGGTVAVSANGHLGDAAAGVSINGGTLNVMDGFTCARNINLGVNGGTVQVDDGLFQINAIGGNNSTFTKTGDGDMRLANGSTDGFNTAVNVRGGTLILGHDTSLGTATASANRAEAPVTTDGGTLDIAGREVAIGNFYLKSGTLDDSEGGGTLSAYAFHVENGVINAALTNLVIQNGGAPQPVNLYKTTAGTVVLTKANAYTGNTFVKEGTLRLEGGEIKGAVGVDAGATLGGAGAVHRTLNVVGGTFAPDGAFTFGRHLYFTNAVFNVIAGGGDYGRAVMTNPEARVLILDDTTLEVVRSKGIAPGTRLTIIENASVAPVEGIFDGLPEGATFNSGSFRYRISYKAGANGTDVVLDDIPTGTVVIVK